VESTRARIFIAGIEHFTMPTSSRDVCGEIRVGRKWRVAHRVDQNCKVNVFIVLSVDFRLSSSAEPHHTSFVRFCSSSHTGGLPHVMYRIVQECKPFSSAERRIL
jgi:hypothetical protein